MPSKLLADCTPEERERLRAARRAYKLRTRKHHLAYKRDWNRAHPEQHHKWNNEHRDKMASYQRRWRAKLRQQLVVENPTEAARAALGKNPLYAAAAAVVPGHYARHTRDDLISMICLAVLEGETTLEQIAADAKGIATRYWREFGQFTKMVSLDTLIPGTDIRMIDTLDSNVEHF